MEKCDKTIIKLIEKCDNCKLNECINCEISYTEVQEIKKLVDRVKDLEAKLNAKEILMNTLPEETDFIILTKKDYNRNYIDELQKKEAIIDLMAKYKDEEDTTEIFCNGKTMCDEECHKCVIEYFKRKIQEEN